MEDIKPMDKDADIKHDSDDSLESGGEGDMPSNGTTRAGSANTNSQDQPIKRKGGRKPIYATSEERKQRNRQAQAAFRERRTEYIKQLEDTIRVHEQNLHNLQTAHRHAADECLMLRYKNSLLERILLEKGIDVQAELRAKTGSPNLGPTHMPQNLVQPPPLPRAILNRHHARRSGSSIAPKLEMGGPSLPPPNMGGMNPGHPTPTSVAASPKSRPTPSSHSASPAASTSVYGQSPAASNPDPSASIRPILSAPPPQQPGHSSHHGHSSALKPGLGAPLSGLGGASSRPSHQQPPQHAQHLQQQQPRSRQHHMLPHLQHAQHPQHPHAQHPHHAQAPNQHPLPSPQPPTPRSTGGHSGTGPYYSVPGFQNHIEQLEQEYDAGDDIMDDHIDHPDTPSGPSPYAPPNHYSNGPTGMSMASPADSVGPSSSSSVMGAQAAQAAQPGQNGYPSMTQLLDPAMDWDPFGLSASMQFPTQFSFDTSNTR